MGHFIEDFSTPLSGPFCPVAVDDTEHKVRYAPQVIRTHVAPIGQLPYLVSVPAWQDYPESHHLK